MHFLYIFASFLGLEEVPKHPSSPCQRLHGSAHHLCQADRVLRQAFLSATGPGLCACLLPGEHQVGEHCPPAPPPPLCSAPGRGCWWLSYQGICKFSLWLYLSALPGRLECFSVSLTRTGVTLFNYEPLVHDKARRGLHAYCMCHPT